MRKKDDPYVKRKKMLKCSETRKGKEQLLSRRWPMVNEEEENIKL
jgi:hypothetical protein